MLTQRSTRPLMNAGLVRMALLLATVVIAAGLDMTVSAKMPEHRVRVTMAEHVDFSRFKTYEWITLPFKEQDTQTMAAIDRELAAAGLSRAPDGQPADLLVGSASISRTHVDVSADRQRVPVDGVAGLQGHAPQMRTEYRVGMLVVTLQDPATGQELFRGRADVPIDLDTVGIQRAIDEVVARIFLVYPGRH